MQSFYNLPLVAFVVMALNLRITNASAFQLNECPVGCSSHGSCHEGMCDCGAGWSGQDCSYFLAGSGAGEEDPLDEEEECVDECSAHGTCSGGVCKCAAGWGGLSCNIAAQCPETCKAPNGQCNAGSCVCAAGFFGPQCADALCPQNCFGHGSCNSGACECAQGWFGRLCDSELDAVSMCDPPCSNSGQCVSGQCYCGPGFTGIDCSLQVQVTPAQASSLAAAAPVVETPRAPPVQIPSTVSMANKLQELQEELQDVSHKTQKLQAKHGKSASAPHMRKQPLMLAQVDGSVPNWAMEAVYPSQQQSVAQPGIPSGLYPARLAGNPPALHRENFAASRPRETIPMPMEVAAPPQPAAMQANLNAVRRATAAAGNAADKLRRTAQKEFATAANNRMQHAYRRAHAHEKNLPGYQVYVPTPVAAPVLAVPAQTPIESLSMNFKPNFGASPPVAHAGTAKDSDNEDSEDTESQEELDPVHNLDEEALQASQRLHGVTHMMVSAMRTPVAKCEADCGGHGMCVRQGAGNACKCAPGWVGMLCDTARCENDCNGRGLCLKGHCLCGKGWLGSTCGHLRCPDDCSGVGYCFAGRCRCKTGYDGPNCAQVKPAGLSVSVKMMPLALIKAPPPINPHFEGMTLRAVPAKLCPDNCNGRGHCSKEGECMCNVGYSGLACELFCPNECSHQGDCIEGACLCFAGFLGVDCSIAGCCSGHGTCDDPGTCVCDAGWDGDDCSVKLMCPDPGCSGHGTCTSGKCICAVGFSGGSCAIADGACVPPCGPAGACNPISHKCECQGGAAGPTCLESISSCPKNCNNRGLCMNGACMCGAGFMGADCGKKFFKPGMKPPPPAAKAGAGGDGGGAGGGAGGMPSIVGVGGGGAGAPPAAGGAAAAEDDEDTGDGTSAYGGKSGAAVANAPMVLSKASGGIVCGDGGLCSGHGTCNTELARCDCVTNFFGEVCERQHCAGFFQKRLECNGHGLCEMGECQCAPGFGMAPFRMLERPIPPQQCFDKVCPVGCGMHGKCIEGQCVCQQGWQGVNCKDPQCPNDCAGHGQCVFQSIHSPGQCTCNYGWGGAGCQRVAVYAQLKSCANDCSGNGLCMDGMCACNVGFKGPDCSDIVCSGMMTGPKCDQPRCPNDCNGRGLCMNGMCACWSYYAGKQCRIPVACVETCGELCETPGQEQKCNNCIGMCESSAPRSSSVFGSAPLGSHNPFEDLQSTLLQQSFKPGHGSEHGSEWIALRQNQSHGHHAVEHAANKKKRTSHSHHEVYQRLEKASFAQFPHAASQHHAHHHKEVSATIVTAF